MYLHDYTLSAVKAEQMLQLSKCNHYAASLSFVSVADMRLEEVPCKSSSFLSILEYTLRLVIPSHNWASKFEETAVIIERFLKLEIIMLVRAYLLT